MRSPKGTKRAGMIRKNQPGNFASASLPPIKPNKTVQPEAIIVRRVKYSNIGVEGNCFVKAKAARAMDMIKKIKPIIIFFFKRGVVTFLNLILPSSNPVKKDKTTQNGRKNDSTFIV